MNFNWRSLYLAATFGAAVGAVLLSSQACSRREAESRIAAPSNPVLQERRDKDQFFKTNPDSPIPPEDRASFRNLAYYDIDDGLRFRVQLHRYPSPETLRIGTNTGEMRRALRYGYFEFTVAGQLCRLQVYRLEEDSERGMARLFIPFRDATSGSETYGSGRYLDFDENTSGSYDLDFNRAYNPYCIYEKSFSCPVPPIENTLTVPIRAGEKTYPPAATRTD
jgi:uncharacterized protein (DUF1684 family)